MPATVDFTKPEWKFGGANEPGGVVITTTAVTVDNQPSAENIWFYKDYGAGFWGDAVLKFEFTLRDEVVSTSKNELAVMVALTNSLGSWTDLNAADAGVLVFHTDFSSTGSKASPPNKYKISADHMPSVGDMPTGVSFTIDVKYYVTVTRTAATQTVVAQFYSDADRTVLVDSSTRVGSSDPGSLRYLTVYATGERAGGPNYLTIENLDDGVSNDFAGGFRSRERSWRSR